MFPQFGHLALGGLALRFPKARGNSRGAGSPSQFGERLVKPPDLRLGDSR
jgi:hypothetical protein